jgi:peptidyl-tRNA hydrolase
MSKVIKMYCIFAKESVQKMNGIRGKMCTQAGHAYLHAYWDAIPSPHSVELTDVEENRWKQALAYKNSERAYKITLVVDTVDELKSLQEKYKNICGTSLVTDAGFTVFNEPTTTCLGIGPIAEENIGDDIKSLKTFT